jgi:hypothetical protein
MRLLSLGSVVGSHQNNEPTIEINAILFNLDTEEMDHLEATSKLTKEPIFRDQFE